MVPTDLGFLDGPFVPHNPISTQESTVPLLKFQMAPRLKILMPSRSMQGTQIYFSSLSKIPANEPPPGSPTGPLWRERLFYRIFCISLENPIKMPLNKKALRKKRPFLFPKSWVPMETDAHFRALLDISFGSPVKEPFLKVSFMESLAKRCPDPRAPLHSPFKVPGIRAPF
jgi:hypothetical protein